MVALLPLCGCCRVGEAERVGDGLFQLVPAAATGLSANPMTPRLSAAAIV